MTRGDGLWKSLGVSAIVVCALAVQAVGADPISRSECGFTIDNAKNWRKIQRDNDTLQLATDRAPYTWVTIGPITDISRAAGSGEALAQAAVGEYCLVCLRSSLIWIDRFLQDQMTVNYTIESAPFKFYGMIYPYYVLRYFIFSQGAPGRTGESGGWTRADLRFYVPQSEFREREQIIMDMARSFRFTEPTKKDCKW
jgi:hypothetical protein